MADTDSISTLNISKSFFDLSAIDIHGVQQNFSNFENKKAIIVVNVACKCGLTSDHYKQLVNLYSEHKSAGLEILAFPCNQFGAQEPWPAEEILSFTKTTFGVEFPIFEKIDVNGANTHQVFQYLRANSSLRSDQSLKKIPWNFAKFLINPKTQQIEYFHPEINPDQMVPSIKALLS